MELRRKTEKYIEILGGIPNAIFVLSGSIRNRGGGLWTSTNYEDKDKNGILGGHARIVAAAELGEYFPHTKLVTTSRVDPNEPTHASVMARELQELGVPADQILQEDQSNSTRSEMVEMVKFSKNKGWNHISVLTSDYHIPRTKELYENLEKYLKKEDALTADEVTVFKSKTRVTFIGAEYVLPIKDEKYVSVVESLHASEEYKKRVKSEEEGIAQLKARDLQSYSKRWDPNTR